MATKVARVIQTAAMVSAATGLVMTGVAMTQQGKIGYDDTPMQPGGKWRVHDGGRPQPKMVTPGTPATTVAGAPADATVLVGPAADLSAWQHSKGAPVTWEMKDGVLWTGKGMIETKAQFTDYQLHVEFATPSEVKGDGQGRGNSGVFLNGVFEVQVLDSYQNPTYPDGQASAMYGQRPPMVNASRKPGEWQVYDIVFKAPRFSAAGALDAPATVTVLHNGIAVHHAATFDGPTDHKRIGTYAATNAKGPIRLQDHGNPVRYRNIWIRPVTGYDQP